MNIQYKKLILSLVLTSIMILGSRTALAQEQAPSPQATEGQQTPDMEGFEPEVEAAQDESAPTQEYSRAEIVDILDSQEQSALGTTQFFQKLKVKFLSGAEKGKEAEIEYRDVADKFSNRKLQKGATVVVVKVQDGDQTEYQVIDQYRIPAVVILLVVLLILALLIARVKGVLTVVGFALVVALVLKFLLPQILAGHSAMLFALLAALIASAVMLYASRGFSKQVTLSFISTAVTVVITGLLTYAVMAMAKIFGVPTEESVYAQSFFEGAINLKGLTFSGILLTLVGMISYASYTQTKTVLNRLGELSELNFKNLFMTGLKHGADRSAALLAVLFLFYLGVSISLFLLFSVGTSQPAWILINSEFVIGQIVYMVMGGIALLLAVPIASAVAAYYYGHPAKETPPVVATSASESVAPSEPVSKAEDPKPEDTPTPVS